MDPLLLIAIIGALGIGAQWVAWRLQMPAIVLMLVAGVVAGPVTGLIDPEAALGELLRPIVAIAVAVILFEGGLTLNLSELRQTGVAVRRIVLIGGPLGWLFSALAIHYGAGLSWESSAVFGGLLIVTGPTVIIPLLRQARLKSRPASILRWEAIVNDPIGALFAVLAFEVVAAQAGAGSLAQGAEHFAIGVGAAVVAGLAAGRGLAFAFRRGMVPEYMKVSVLLGMVVVVYASTDSLLHESGLLAVTIMGVVLANSKLPSIDEIRRFKEHVTIILVSGVFILLAASLQVSEMADLSWRAVIFVALIMFVARPLTVALSLLGSGVDKREQIMVAWIAPRGIVAVAVAGLFGVRLEELGVEDGALLAPLAFVLVAATVVQAGFTMKPVASALGLTSSTVPGVLIVGSVRWSISLAKALKDAGLPVLVADRNWYRLGDAREAGLEYYHGEILSEAAEHHLDLNAYGTLIAASDNAAYNSLVCTDFAPEFGRLNVFQPGRGDAEGHVRGLPVTLGGRTLAGGLTYSELMRRTGEGSGFKVLDGAGSWDAWEERNSACAAIAIIRGVQPLLMLTGEERPKLREDDRVLAIGPETAEGAAKEGDGRPTDDVDVNTEEPEEEV